MSIIRIDRYECLSSGRPWVKWERSAWDADFVSEPLDTCAGARPSVDCAGNKCRRGRSVLVSASRAERPGSGPSAGLGAVGKGFEEGLVSATARQAQDLPGLAERLGMKPGH